MAPPYSFFIATAQIDDWIADELYKFQKKNTYHSIYIADAILDAKWAIARVELYASSAYAFNAITISGAKLSKSIGGAI